MDIQVYRESSVKPQNPQVLGSDQQPNATLTGLANQNPQHTGFLRELYITYDMGTGTVSGVTRDGVTFSGKVGQSIYVAANGSNPGLSFTVNLDASIAPTPPLQVALPPGGSLTYLGSLVGLGGGMSLPPSGLLLSAASTSLAPAASPSLLGTGLATAPSATPLTQAAIAPSAPTASRALSPIAVNPQPLPPSGLFALSPFAVNPQPLPPGIG